MKTNPRDNHRPAHIPTRPLLAVATLFGIVGLTLYFGTGPATGAHAETTAVPSYIQAAEILHHARPDRLALRSQVALVQDGREGIQLLARGIDTPRPIASLTKLMTALVVLESGLALDAPITITTDDRDRLKGTRSRLHYGAILTREDLLRAALGASDNRAAAALARTYPGGTPAFLDAMNQRAWVLGMNQSHFADASGLDRRNRSTARDLLKLLEATQSHPRILAYSTSNELWVTNLATGRPIDFINTNRLVRRDDWVIGLSKTGYTADAGNCLIMQVTVGTRPVNIVLLNSWGKLSKYGDAERIRDWLIDSERRAARLRTASL